MLLGFGLIGLAWIIQLAYIVRGDRNVQPAFIGVYLLAVLILAGSDVIDGAADIAYAELVTVVAAALTLAALIVIRPK